MSGSGLSYGHDIEASWLLMESGQELADYKPGDTALVEQGHGSEQGCLPMPP